ncbi:MAG: DUF5715 family protein [Gemmatirosa sp.]
MTQLRRAGIGLLLALVPGLASASALGGSKASMLRQHRMAEQEGLAFLSSEKRVRALVEDGVLEPVMGNADYVVLASVGHKVARPEVRLLIERLAAQYHAATGERLVVTSLVRPIDEQPANAHQLSVHPAGIAMDLRVPAKASSRQWLERTLLGLEQKGLLDVTRERRPPHYHVAVFPAAYRAYAEAVGPVRTVAAATTAAPVAVASVPLGVQRASIASVSATLPAPGAPATLIATLMSGIMLAVAVVVIVRERPAYATVGSSDRHTSLLGLPEGG